MYRAPLQGRKVFSDRWRRHHMELHRKRLKTIEASIDNEAPPKFQHLRSKKKKVQQLLERYSNIERENRILLEKMAEIMGRPSYDFKAPPKIKSLNSETRRRKLEKITQENQQILKRIQASEPNYDHREWDRHWEDQQNYLRNLCEYPCIFLGDKGQLKSAPHLDVDPRRRVRVGKRHNLGHRSTSPPTSLSQKPSSGESLPDIDGEGEPSGAATLQKIKMSRKGRKHSDTKTLLREGRNISGTYVIISVLSKGKRRKREWVYKMYEPQFSDEVSLRIPAATVEAFAAQAGRDDLLHEDRLAELAAFSLTFLKVTSSASGSLNASFRQEDVPEQQGDIEEGELADLIDKVST